MATINPDDFHFHHKGMPSKLATKDDLLNAQSIISEGTSHPEIGILIIHGYTSTTNSMRFISTAMIEQGYTVSTPRLAGHGTNIQDFETTPWQEWMQSVTHAYQQLQSQCSTVYVIGQSLGGCLALLLAAQHSDIKHLFLLAPAVFPPRLLTIGTACAPLLKLVNIHYLQSLGGKFMDPTAYELTYKKIPIATHIELNKCLKHTQIYLNCVTTPTTIFFSKNDPVVPCDNPKKILNQISSEDKQCLWLDEGYHIISQDLAYPKVINNIKNHIAQNLLA